jgi:hypothetical protein
MIYIKFILNCIYIILKLATRCLKLVVEHSEQYHYYMAVCENKKGNYSASLEHLEHKILLGKYVSSLTCYNCTTYLLINYKTIFNNENTIKVKMNTHILTYTHLKSPPT